MVASDAVCDYPLTPSRLMPKLSGSVPGTCPLKSARTRHFLKFFCQIHMCNIYSLRIKNR